MAADIESACTTLIAITSGNRIETPSCPLRECVFRDIDCRYPNFWAGSIKPADRVLSTNIRKSVGLEARLRQGLLSGADTVQVSSAMICPNHPPNLGNASCDPLRADSFQWW